MVLEGNEPAIYQIETLETYQPYKLDNLTLTNEPLTCGDRRGLKGIHLFGGVLYIAYEMDVVREAVEPGSVTGTFEDSVRSLVPILIAADINPEVHSDEDNEAGDHYHEDNNDGAIGCKYAEFRRNISQLIVKDSITLLDTVRSQRPELFTDPKAEEFASSLISAHERLSSSEKYFSSTGRQVVNAAIESGAKVKIVPKVSSACHNGIINLENGTSFDTVAANKANESFYDHDSWANRKILDRIHDTFPFSKLLQDIADAIDTNGTLNTLEVTNIMVNRG